MNYNRLFELQLITIKLQSRVQTPLGAQLSLGTQSRYEAPGDLRVENVKMQ